MTGSSQLKNVIYHIYLLQIINIVLYLLSYALVKSYCQWSNMSVDIHLILGNMDSYLGSISH